METVQNEGENNKELDDSGVQDVGKQEEQEEERPPELLDLSDDVLLGILKFCSPMDLKALGYTCPRLGRLIRDRTLWIHVDARQQPTGTARMRWLLAHALGRNTVELKLSGYAKAARGTSELQQNECATTGHALTTDRESLLARNTVELKLSGYAKAARGCVGYVQRTRKEVEQEREMCDKQREAANAPGRSQDHVHLVQEVDSLARLQRLYVQSRFPGTPMWPSGEWADEDAPPDTPDGPDAPDGCPGPQFTLSQCMLRRLRARCSLSVLALEYCNIDCNTTSINNFPPTLKWLSLRGSRCYNLPVDKSFLFNVQDLLPEIEHLDLSECTWMEPSSLLPLSKAPRLKRLLLRECPRLAEFVAYASLAARYGFRTLEAPRLKRLLLRECPRLAEFVAYASLAARYGFWTLEVLDLRGSPVADSEVSALGWLPALQELYIAPAREAPAPDHRHYSGEPLPAFRELEPWEVDEPEYFKIQAETTENNDQNLCLHGVDYNLCTEGTTRRSSGLKRPAEQSTSTDEPQPAMSSVKVIEVSLRNPGESRTISSSVHVIPPFRPRQSLIDPLDLASPAKKKKTEEDDEEESSKGSRDVSTNTPWVIDYNTCQIVGKRTFKEFEAYPSGSGTSDQPGPSKKKKLDTEEKPGCSKDACKSKPVKSCPQPGSSKDACPKKDSKKKSSSPKDGSGSSKDGPGSSKDGPGSSKDGETKTRPFNKSITSRNIIFAQPGRSNDEAGPSSKKDTDSEGSLNTANRVVYYAPQNENAPNDSSTEPNQQQEEEANSEFRNTQAEPGPSRRMVFILPPENHCCVRNRPNPFPNMPGPSTHRRFVVSREPAENSEEEESENVPEDLSADRKSQDPNPNDVAGPSRDPDRPDKNNQDCHKPTEHSSGCKCKNSHKYEYVRFRQNMDPVIVRRDPADVEREEREREHAFENREVRPRAHVLYVNVGQQLHSVYRLSIHTEPPIYYTFGGNRHIALRPNVGNLFYPSYTPHLDAASLVTDFAVRRFGRAEIEDINVVHIGPRVDGGEVGARPDRSNLRILSITGFRNITDRSLAHLVSSAPHLRLIDFSRTRVSSQGVENFRCLRPDCQVIYSEFTENGE